MAQVVFFHNVREDNARRTGLVVGERRVLEYFVDGDEEPSPVLRWYFDVIVQSDVPPERTAEAREWMATHADAIRRVLTDTSEKLAAGIDTDFLPWSYEFSTTDGPVRVSLNAVRRYDARNVANNIRQFLATDFLALTEAAAPAA